MGCTHTNNMSVFACVCSQTLKQHLLLKTNRKHCRRRLFKALEAAEETAAHTCYTWRVCMVHRES